MGGGAFRDYEHQAADLAGVGPLWEHDDAVLNSICREIDNIADDGPMRAHRAQPRLCASSVKKGYLSAAQYMSPKILSRFEPVARAQLKQVVTNRISLFFAVDSEKVEGKDPLVVTFIGERITYVGRSETERKPFQYRVTRQHVARTQQNPYGLVVSSIEQHDAYRPHPVQSEFMLEIAYQIMSPSGAPSAQ